MHLKNKLFIINLNKKTMILLKNKTVLLSISLLTLFGSCSDDDDTVVVAIENTVEVPANYSFSRNGESTVSFSGQTARIQMAEEMITAFFEPTNTVESLNAMYAHEEGAANFSNNALNSSNKNIKSKVATSIDFFAANAAESAQIKQDFETFIAGQVNEVFPAWETLATPGVPGQIAEGSTPRYVNAKGLEYDQAFVKGLMGALMTDQMLNNYLSTAVLDAGQNIENNNSDTTEEGKPYTTMEHKWDEGYGYLFGNAPNAANPLETIGDDDNYLNKYLGRQEGDPDFAGASQRVFNAFALGRAAIVAKNYELRNTQVEIIRKEISEMIGIRAVYYLQIAKIGFTSGEIGAALHDLSEGYGFVYSLQFSRNPETNQPNFSTAEVNSYLATMLETSPNGLWDIPFETLDELSNTIAARFDFTVAEANN
ncbi:MAG: hypothetical protein ACJA1Z_003089 [Patiriisocius sp.]